jgi:hypothetical protein
VLIALILLWILWLRVLLRGILLRVLVFGYSVPTFFSVRAESRLMKARSTRWKT